MDTAIAFIFMLCMGAFAGATFLLANMEKEGFTMTEVIKVTPNKDGKYIVVLYGHTIELVPAETKKAETKKAE